MRETLRASLKPGLVLAPLHCRASLHVWQFYSSVELHPLISSVSKHAPFPYGTAPSPTAIVVHARTRTRTRTRAHTHARTPSHTRARTHARTHAHAGIRTSRFVNPTIWTDKLRATTHLRRGEDKRGIVLARWGGLGNHRYQVHTGEFVPCEYPPVPLLGTCVSTRQYPCEYASKAGPWSVWTSEASALGVL